MNVFKMDSGGGEPSDWLLPDCNYAVLNGFRIVRRRKIKMAATGNTRGGFLKLSYVDKCVCTRNVDMKWENGKFKEAIFCRVKGMHV